MKFCWGAIPRGEELPPGNWRALREPGPLVAQVLALPLGLAVGAGALALWLWRVPFYEMSRSPMAAFFAVLALLFPAHEALHVLVHPGGGRNSVVGVWPAKLICYAVYQGPVSRARLTLILLAPLLGLTFAPLMWTLITGHASLLAMFVSVVNAFGSCLDLLGVWWLWRQVPRDGVAQNVGWRTFWHHAD